MDPALTRAATTAGSALSRYAVRAALGSARQRALDNVYQRAVRRAVTNVASTTTSTELDLVHAVGLLERLVSGASEGDIPLLATEDVDGREVTARWRDIASESGLDPDTFPLPFEALVDQLLRAVADEAARYAVDADGSALFPAVAFSQLDNLRKSLHTLARLTPLAGNVAYALQAAARSCRQADRAVLTPDVLLALLHLADGSVAACFDAAAPGLSGRTSQSLRRYLETTTIVAFRPFEWVERAEVRQAQTYAWVHGVPAVTGPILLLGILDTPSNTRDQLTAALGPRLDMLRAAALSRMDEVAECRTPGTVFHDDMGLA